MVEQCVYRTIAESAEKAERSAYITDGYVFRNEQDFANMMIYVEIVTEHLDAWLFMKAAQAHSGILDNVDTRNPRKSTFYRNFPKVLRSLVLKDFLEVLSYWGMNPRRNSNQPEELLINLGKCSKNDKWQYVPE